MSAPNLLRGDARALPLADESVDLIVTSPPYFGLRDYGYGGQIGAEATPHEFVAALVECTREMVRVLKPAGSIFVNLGDKYSTYESRPGNAATHEWAQKSQQASRYTRNAPEAYGAPYKSLLMLPERYRIAAVDELGLIARQVLVWSKPNGMPESVTDRCRRTHEDWVHLTKSQRYYSTVDEIRESYADGTAERYRTGYGRTSASSAGQTRNGVVRADNGGPSSTNPLGRLPGSVWSVATQPLNVPEHVGADHYAAFPMEWPRRLIAGWCPPDGTVLDPFGGTGTTALVASMLGRRGISVELSADYQHVARWRCGDPRERGRAAGLDAAQVARVPAARPDQGGLFEVTA